MKTFPKWGLILGLLALLSFSVDVNAQLLKKLGKRAEKAAERTIERRVEKETEEKTDQTLDSILDPGKKGRQKLPEQNPIPTDKDEDVFEGNSENSSTKTQQTQTKNIQVYSKFDYVPGDKQLFFEDFASDFVGDFPSKWNTNGSGEVVTLGDSSEKWLEMKPGSNIFYIPDVPELPEEYTIEFDTRVVGVDRQTSSAAKLNVILSDESGFKYGNNYVRASIPFVQYLPPSITMKNHMSNGGGDINSSIKADIRAAVLDRPHFSIAVNKERFRLWVNETKYVDIPRIMPTETKVTALKFRMGGFKDNDERLFIGNLKVAEGGVDLRRKLISEGKVSTNGILFDSGSANIKPESMGIIRQIYQVLQQDTSINLKIVGHTDADGGDEANLTLSKSRAEAVKNALVNVYSVDGARLSTEGKGELEPVADNTTSEGKAQNRRVEFIKQ